MASSPPALARWTIGLLGLVAALGLLTAADAFAAHGGSIPRFGDGEQCRLVDFLYDDGHTEHFYACGDTAENDITSAEIPILHVRELHTSCSDVFTDGTFDKGDPTSDEHPGVHTVVRYHIVHYSNLSAGTQTKECGEEFTADADITVCVDLKNDASGDGTYTDDELAPGAGEDAPERVVVTNCGTEDHVIDSLTIDGEDVCGSLLGTTLAAGDSTAPCDLTQSSHTPPAGGTETDTVTVVVYQPGNKANTASASDPTSMRSPVPPVDVCVELTNDASGDGTYTDDEVATAEGLDAPEHVVVTNCGSEPHVIDSLKIDGVDVCASLIGTEQAPGDEVECDLTQTGHTPPDGGTETDTVTVVVFHPDDEGTTATDSDPTAMTTTVPEPPSSPPPPSEPGDVTVCVDLVNDASGDGTYSDDEFAIDQGLDVPERVTVTNCGDEPYVIDELAIDGDDVCPELIGVRMEPGESETCDLVLSTHTPPIGTSRTDTVEVLVHHPDDETLTATDSDPTAMNTGDAGVLGIGDEKTPAGEPDPVVIQGDQLPATGTDADLSRSAMTALVLGMLLVLGAVPIVRQTSYARDDLRRYFTGR